MLAALVLPMNAESDFARRDREFSERLERDHERRQEGFRQDRNEQIARDAARQRDQIARDAAAQREQQIEKTEQIRREVERVRVEHNYYYWRSR